MKRLVLIALFAAQALAQQTRIASDFEIAQMQQQLAHSNDFLSRLSAHLNLGDLRATRGENSVARREYAAALDLAAADRLDARRASNMARYATATSYAALAQAKLRNAARAYDLSEEALRYESGSAKTWNLYASTMSLLAKPAKAASASRNAVAIAERELAQSSTIGNRIDLAVYQYALASALVETGDMPEAEELLVKEIATLRGPAFDDLRRDVVHREAFEIYSSARGEASSYIALLNRSQLRLAAMYETRGDTASARSQYESVLASRSDDPTALAGMARLAQSGDRFAEAFDANPFSQTLIRDYQRYLTTHRDEIATGDSTGARVRRVLIAASRHETHTALRALDELQRDYPDNDTLRDLRNTLESHPVNVPGFLSGGTTTPTPSAGELRSLLRMFDDGTLSAEQRARLDTLGFMSTVLFDDAKAGATEGQTIFESGNVDGVPFRFSEPIAFRGTFVAHAPLRLTYRVLGSSNDALLVEPVKLEATP